MAKERLLGKSQEVDINKVKPNPWNPNRQSDFIFRKQVQSIKDEGFIGPIIVRESKNEYQILDGEHRWKAAKELNYKKIKVENLGEIPDTQAKKITILLNELKGQSDSFRLAVIVEELSKQKVNLNALPFNKDHYDLFEDLLKVPEYKEGRPEFEEEKGFKNFSIIVTLAQYEIIQRAIRKVVKEHRVKEGRALELICAEYLS